MWSRAKSAKGADAAIAEVERGIAASLGEQQYREFKRSFRRVAQVLAQRSEKRARSGGTR